MQQVACRRHALFGSVGAVLDPHGHTEERVVPAGDVAGAVDTGRGLAVPVADQPVGAVQTTAVQPCSVRQRADGHQHLVGLDPAAASQHRAVVGHLGDRDAGTQNDAVLAVRL